MATKTETKIADLRYITTLKNKPYIKIYTYRSSDDTKDYQVTTVHGRVSSCTTPATHPCYICKDAQAREDSRKQEEQASREAAYEKIVETSKKIAESKQEERASREALPLNGQRGFSLMR